MADPTVQLMGVGLARLIGTPAFQEFTDDEKVQMIKVYKEADAAKRVEILKDFQPEPSMLEKGAGEVGKFWRGETPSQQQGFKPVLGEQLGSVANMILPTSPRQAAAMGVGGAVSGALSKGAARYAPGLASAADVLGGYLGRQANVGLGLEQKGDPALGSMDVGDILSAGIPAALRGGGAIAGMYGKFGTAGRALSQNDQAVALNTAERAYIEANFRQKAAERAARIAEANRKGLADYNEVLTKSQPNSPEAVNARNAYRDRLLEAEAQAKSLEAEHIADYNTAMANYNARVKAQEKSAGDLQKVTEKVWGDTRNPEEVRKKITNAYDLVQKAGDPRIKWDNPRSIAQEVMEELEMRFSDFRDHKLWRIAKSVRDLGVTEATPGATSSIVDPVTNQPVVSPGKPRVVEDPRFSEVRPNLEGSGLGGALANYRSEGGADYGLAKKLYRAMDQAMSAGGEANAALRNARSLARTNFALEEVDDLFTPRQGGVIDFNDRLQIQLHPGRIKGRLEAMKDDMFVGSFKPGELAGLEREIDRLIRIEGIRNPPGQPGKVKVPEVKPTAAELKAMTPGAQPQPFSPQVARPAATISDLSPRRQFNLADPEAQLPEFRPGRQMMAGMGAGMAAGGAASFMTGQPYQTMVPIGGAIGASAPIVGRIIAQAMLTPQLRPMLRHMMGDTLAISPEQLALLSNLTRIKLTNEQ